MRKSMFAAGLLSAALVMGAATSQAQPYDDHHYHHHHRHYARDYRGCEASRRRAANTGTIVGGIGGALVGNALGGGHLGGTLIGGGVGAVAGHQIASNNHRC